MDVKNRVIVILKIFRTRKRPTFEMIVNSTTEWKYASSKKIIAFYKKTSLKKDWSNLIEELNKPGEQFALKCFEKFINEMSIQTI